MSENSGFISPDSMARIPFGIAAIALAFAVLVYAAIRLYVRDQSEPAKADQVVTNTPDVDFELVEVR